MNITNLDDLLLTHGPSGITGRAEDIMPQICKWLHRNRPEQLCWAEEIFKDPSLNQPCPKRLEIEKESK